MKTIDKTGVPQKNPGDGLSHKDINAINTTVNDAVDAVNMYLRNDCNINTECGDPGRQFTLSAAIEYVPSSRRAPGLKVKYLSTDGMYVEFIYNHTSTDDEYWKNTDYWRPSINIIDGGVW